MKFLACGKNVKSIGYLHLKSCSGLTTKQYKEKFPGASLMDDDIKLKCVHFKEKNKSYKPEIHNKTSWERVCSCGNIVTHKSYESYLRSIPKKTCEKCAKRGNWKRRKHTDKSKNKISEANKGKEYNKSKLGIKESLETKKRKSKSLKGRKPGFENKVHSPETKLKQRLKRLQDLEKKLGKNWRAVNYNKDACKLFEEINRELGWNGQHAEKGGEYKILGYFLDYYEPTKNVVIEFDEKRHEIPKIKAKDIQKQKEVTEVLKCRFFRIKEEERFNWRNIII